MRRSAGEATARALSRSNPPLAWSRRVADFAITNARYQARKPKRSEKPADSLPLELGIVKDWLVLGPFPSNDPAADIEKPFIPNEASVEPDENDAVGKLRWKLLHATIDTQSTHYTNEGTCEDYNVDFIFLYGQLDNQVAYAHTYIYSPTGGNVQLSIHRAGTAGKIWLNGQPALMNPKDWNNIFKTPAVLRKGWNSLLVKLSCEEGTKPEGQNPWISKWRFSSYFSAPLPAEYTTQHIVWMTKLPGFSASAPIVVGDRIFTTCGTSDLMCLNKRNGRVLWLTTCTPCDALTPAEKAESDYKESVAPLEAQLQQADRAVMAQVNELNALHGLPKQQQEAADTLIRSKHELEKKLHDALRQIDRKRFVPMYGNEVSGTNGTPCTDGERVYVATGGGMKGPGAYVIAAYNLNGKRIWSYHEALGAPEHGTHVSPALVGGKLIYAANTTILAFEPATGKIAWRHDLGRDAQNCCSCLFVPALLGRTPVVIAYPNMVVRAADGEVLGRPSRGEDENLFATFDTPAVEQGWLFAERGNAAGGKKTFEAVQLPTEPGQVPRDAWKLDPDQWRLEKSSGFSIASGTVVGGLYFSIDTMGGLTVIDLAARKPIYMKRIEMFHAPIARSTASPPVPFSVERIFISSTTPDAACCSSRAARTRKSPAISSKTRSPPPGKTTSKNCSTLRRCATARRSI